MQPATIKVVKKEYTVELHIAIDKGVTIVSLAPEQIELLCAMLIVTAAKFDNSGDTLPNVDELLNKYTTLN